MNVMISILNGCGRLSARSLHPTAACRRHHVQALGPFKTCVALALAGAALTLLGARPVAAQSRQWDGGGANDNWETDANWAGDAQVTTGEFAVFPAKGSLPNPIVTGAPTTAGKIKFQGSGWNIQGDADGRIKLYGVGGTMLNDNGANTFANTISCDVSLQGAGDALEVNGGNRVTISGGVGDAGSGATLRKTGAGQLILSGANGLPTGITVQNGTLSITGTMNGVATVTVSGGTLSTGGADKLADGAAVTVTGGTLTLGGADTVRTLTMSGGTLGGAQTLTATTYGLSGGAITGNLGAGTLNSSGTVALNGTSAANAVNVTAGTLTLGSADRLDDSATVTVSGGTLALGANSDTVGTVILSGGSIAGSGGTLTGTATHDLRNGAVSATLGGSAGLAKTTAGVVVLSGVNTYSGLTTVNAGTLTLGHASDTLNGPITVNGGTLNVDNPDTVEAVTLTAGTIAGDSVLTGSSYEVASGTISAALDGAAAMTKNGAGTVTLSGANTYTGATTVVAGRLTLAGSATSDIAVNAGALGGEGGTTGSLTLNGGSVVSIDTTTDGALTANGVTVAGAVDIAFDVAPSSGTFTVLDYGAGALSGIGNLTATSARGAVVTDDAANHRVRLALTTGARTWAGAPAATWDNGTSTAWQEGDQLFYSGDAVRFDDTASGSTTVTLAGTLVPAAVTFTNETQAYALEGAGAIGGVAALTKEGAGMLTIAAAQAYAGGTTLRGGRLRIGNDSALGTGALTIDGGALSSDSATNRVFAAPVTLNGAFTLGDAADSGALTLAGPIALAADVTVETPTNGAIPHAFAGALSDGDGTFGLTKSGAGTLVLSGANAYDGGTLVDDGTLRMNAPGAFPGAALVNSDGTLTLSSVGNTTWTNAITGTGVLELLLSGVAAANTYLSNAAGFAGTIHVSNSGATGNKWNVNNLGTLNAGLIVDSGSQLLVAGGTTTFGGGIGVLGTGNTENRGAIRIVGATTVLSGAIALLGDTTIGGENAAATIGGDITGTAPAGSTYTLTQGTANSVAGCILSGVITDGASGGNVALRQTQGTLTLSGASSYTGGTTVNAGTINVSGNQAAATGGWTIGKGNTLEGTVNFQAGSAVAAAAGKLIQVGTIPGDTVVSDKVQALNVAGSVVNDGRLALGRRATVSVNSGGAWTQNGDVSLDGIGGATAILSVGTGGTFTYAGAGSIKVNPAASNTGDAWLIIAGTLVTGQGFERTAVPAAGGVATVSLDGGVLRLAGDVADLTVNSAGKPFTFALAAGGGTLDTDGHAGGVSGVISGAGALTKRGAGTLTLSGANTYTGLTTILGGTLRLGATGTLKAQHAVVLDGGTLDAATSANTVGTLRVGNSDGALILGGGSLAFADSRAQAWGSGKIVISGLLGTVAPTNLRFGTSADALTPEQLAALSFNEHTVELDPQGYVIAHISLGTVLIVR